MTVPFDQDPPQVLSIVRPFRQRQLNTFQQENQRCQSLLTVNYVIKTILSRPDMHDLGRFVTDDGRHEMMLVLGTICQLYQICKQILTLLRLPTVKALVRGDPEHAVGE